MKRLKAESFISRKLRFQGNMAAVATAVSFFVIVVAVAVSSGFRHAIREGVARLAGDISIQPYQTEGADPSPLPRHLPSEADILALPGVQALQATVTRAGIVKSGDIVHGVLVKGVDRVDSSLAVSIPQRLSEITGLGVGDPLTTYFIGEKVRVRKFQITAIHHDVVELDNRLVVYANLEDMQRLNGWTEEEVSCLEIRLDRKTRRQMEDCAAELGHLLLNSGHPEEENLYVSASTQRYPQLFDWLNLLDFNVLFILFLMTVVAGFNMVSGLLILLLRNISTVGTLKTLGMDNRAIGRLFVRVGAGAVWKGLLAGNALALLFCLIQGTTHLIPLDPANYYVAWVPVHLDVPALLAADAAAFLLILLLLWLPARVVSTIDPALSVKAD